MIGFQSVVMLHSGDSFAQPRLPRRQNRQEPPSRLREGHGRRFFVTIWAFGFAARGSLGLACGDGFLIGLIVQATTIITYVVSPLPAGIALKWFASGMVQNALLGVVVALTYKPASRRHLA